MAALENLIVSRAERDAKVILKEAKAKRKKGLSQAKKVLDESYQKELELAKKRAEGESSVKAGELHTQFNRWKLAKETEIFGMLRSLLIAEFEKSPKKLFSKVLKNGKKEFIKPTIWVGSSLKGLFRGAVVDKTIRGMRIGQDKIYVSAEIEDVVDAYLEKNYSQILGELFGEKK